MAVDQISAVIDRLEHDSTFRGRYRVDPDSALSTYHLSGRDVRALKTGDSLELELNGLGEKWDAFVPLFVERILPTNRPCRRLL